MVCHFMSWDSRKPRCLCVTIMLELKHVIALTKPDIQLYSSKPRCRCITLLLQLLTLLLQLLLDVIALAKPEVAYVYFQVYM